ncbi:MAG: hypothetical protein COV99_05315 [Bacteroidetes bacterium CG12_big_fil_rev_8_21_14_0_65_60_17]|nr:MAG: hypothetical protein COV99_05315 [Bacteroidetes bacterium CG12_big_fil_rev_8_21_14_0_65_60_17]
MKTCSSHISGCCALFWALILFVAAGCADPEQPNSSNDRANREEARAPAAAVSNPAAAYEQMESTLLAAHEIRFSYHITSEGVFPANLRGDVRISSEGHAEMTGSGTFGRDSVRVMLLSDGTSMEFGRNRDTLELLTPTHLNDALIVGLTRMGLLHNLARLVAGAPPDRAEEGVRDWVQVGAFSADPAGVAFDITVAGEPAGAAKISLSADGLPTVRRQLVSFPEGQMRVTERYSNFSVR